MPTKRSSGLGRGFETLLPAQVDADFLSADSDRIRHISPDAIVANPQQPRSTFDQTSINELAASIKQHGIIQPLVLTPHGKQYYVIAGERRLRAARVLGLAKVPAIVRTVEELERLEIAIVENVQRVDLSPLEQAVSIEKLHQQFNITYGDIGTRLGKAQSTITNTVRLLQLPEAAMKALAEQRITEGHARAILALKGHPEKQAELLSLIITSVWTVRQAEQYVVSFKQGYTESATQKARVASETPETQLLSKRYGVPVHIKRTARGGRLELTFKTDEELDALINLLNP